MITNECLYLTGLTFLKGVGSILASNLIRYFGSAEAIFKAKRPALAKVQGIGVYIAEQIENSGTEALKRAEKEMSYIDKNKIRLYAITADDYPRRLKECQDAPVVFYYKGNADLDAAKIISVVGTRKISDYGRKLTESLVGDLSAMLPDLLIISGLAYGTDICAHRSALKNNLSTVGVLAHGLDRLYPAVHRNTAIGMITAGGLLTDFASGTTPDRENFVRRNRLVAGLSDATIVVESAERGGSLITADMAFSYGRDVYTFPGRVTDEFSAGCNRLIQMNKAGLISSAKDLVMSLRWDSDTKARQPVQSSFDFQGKAEENQIMRILVEQKEFQINQLATEMNIPVHELSSMLFELEMEGYIKVLPGGVYKLN
jgi:DNA processing protein